MSIPEMKEKNQKKFQFLKKIPFQLGTANSKNREKDKCHWQTMCYETPLRFNIELREIFSEAGSAIGMKKYDESALMQISQDFGTL